MTQTSHSLLLQWLSGASLDEVFENGRHTQAGRAIEAVKGIVQARIQIQGESDRSVVGDEPEDSG